MGVVGTKMTTITVIGDVHGKTQQYQKIIRQKYQDCKTIQIGDMGIGFAGVGLHKMSDDHRWFRGNHDDPAKCRNTTNYMGDWGLIPDTKLMWIAGAFSVDRDYRIPGISWWPDEELSYEELQKVIATYSTVKPDYVLSHEAPSRAGRALLDHLMGPYFSAKQNCCNSRTAEALQQMFDIHRPKEWVFGHYHIDKSFMIENTKFICVAELSTYDLVIP